MESPRTDYHRVMGSAIQLDEDLLREVERVAAGRGQTLASVVEQALREMLARRVPKREPVQLPTFRGLGLRPGVDLDNSAGLLDLMERADDSG